MKNTTGKSITNLTKSEKGIRQVKQITFWEYQKKKKDFIYKVSSILSEI